MKKLLVALALLAVSTLGYADVEVFGDGNSMGIYLVDDKTGKVVFCWRDKSTGTHKQCNVITDNFRKVK